ncbi:MAG: hypothetical protein M1816_000897 [Peltula sp. TS41687]|nr:MAG: hypothetical protein M1816_000897 [Peltula sp. TS41687]
MACSWMFKSKSKTSSRHAQDKDHTDTSTMDSSYSHDIETLRRREYPTLRDVTYLDHAGTTIYADSLIRQFARDMRSNLFGNPHSASPSSELSTRRVENVRARVLSFFHADPEHFDVVFLQNSTAAIKLVADAFSEVGPPGFWYGYHRDAHTSLVGVFRLAAQSRCFESDQEVEDWLRADGDRVLGKDHAELSRNIGLFAYPAQSNMNGHRLPLDWPARVRESSHAKHQDLYVLLDAAAYVMTAELDLSEVESAPDFVALSFYKIFGFPDLGALIVRKTAGEVLQRRRFFGGGTVDMLTVLENTWIAKKETTLHEQLEDGTLPFHHIIALGAALDVHAELYGSMANISRYTCSLAADLYEQLGSLRHANGRAVCEIYKDPRSEYGDAKTQGPTIAFNVRNAQGGWIGKSDVERRAIDRNIHLRTGGVCNPGGIATFCGLAYWEMRQNYFEGMRCGDDLDILGGKPTGIVRVSLGAMSSPKDVERFIHFIQDLFVETELPAPRTRLFPSVEAQSLVESLCIYPIVGCAGWRVPSQVAWSISERGLAWNDEWCVVRLDDNSLLDPLTHPRLTTIKPYLEVKNGLLRLVALNTTSSTTEAGCEEVNISLWDSPPERSVLDFTRPQADPYQAEEISKFFTAVLGVPSTLARFQDIRKLRRKGHAGACASSLTMTTLTEKEQRTNITLAQPYNDWRSQRYMRIGTHYFELSGKPTDKTGGSATLVYLPNPYDRSPAAQNPTIRVGDRVQLISELESRADPALQVCIASKHVGEHICPVWDCRKDFALADQLASHLQAHRSRPRPHKRITATEKIIRDSSIFLKSTDSVALSAFEALKVVLGAVGSRVR